MIRSVRPPAARLLGRPLEVGSRLTTLFPDDPAWPEVLGHLWALTDEAPPAISVSLADQGDVTLQRLDLDGHDELWVWQRQRGLPKLLKRLSTLQQALLTAWTIEDVVEAILAYLHTEVYGVVLAQHDPADDTLVTHHRVHFDPAHLNGYDRIPVVAPLPITDAFRSGQELILTRAECAERYPSLELAPQTQQLLALPLRSAERVLGVLLLSVRDLSPLDEMALARLRLLASYCAVALDRAHLFDALQLGEQRYRTLLEATHAFVWETDADFQVRRPTLQWEAFTGQSLEEYRGFGYLNALPTASRARFLRIIQHARREQQPVSFELQVRGRSGQLMQGQVDAVPIRNAAGELRAWMGTMVDVTEQRLTQRRQTIIQQVLQQLGAAVHPQQVLRAVMHAARAACHARAALVTQPDEHGGWQEAAQQDWAAVGLSRTLVPAALAQVVQAADPCWLLADGSLTSAGLGAPLPPSAGAMSVLALPLRAGGGFRAAVLLAVPAHFMTPDAWQHLQWIQPHLAHALQRGLLLQALQRREDQGRRILDALDEALVLCDRAGHVQQTNGAAYHLSGVGEHEQLMNILDPAWALQDPEGRLLRPDEYPAAIALRTGQPVRDVLVRRTGPEARVHWLSINAVPWRENGEICGVVVSTRNVTEPHLLRQQLEAQAQHDELTQLPNRRMFNAAVRRLAAAPGGGAVLLLDLDRFKMVNDTHGHHIGDALLQGMARRLEQNVAAPGLCSRLAGDEFGVVLPGASRQEARAHVTALLPALEQPLCVRGVTLHPQVSIGLCVHDRQDWDAADWFKGADLALHDAKQQGRSRWSEYSPLLEQRHARRAAIEQNLRHALDEHTLSVEFQPIAQPGQPGWLRFEALVRWTDPVLGHVPPEEFIPVAEEAGLIGSLGAQVLSLSLRQAATWSRSTRQRVCVHVNVSAAQLEEMGFTQRVEHILRDTGCLPSQLVVELTESVAIDTVRPVVHQLHALRSLGVRIALDDFGTGHSSLGTLERLPIDSVKIDRAFVQNIDVVPRRQSLLSAMLRMGEELGIEVIVEGVESAGEHEVIEELGFQLVQGYHVSHPLEAARFLARRDGLGVAPRGALPVQE